MKNYYLHHHHKIQLGKIIHSSLWRFDFSVWLHTFARSLVSIFIPILMLTKGYQIKDVALFYLIYNIIDVPLNFFVGYFIQKFNALAGIMVGNIAVISFFIILSQVHEFTWSILLLLAFLAAVYDTFYWVSHLFIFMEVSAHHKNVGQETSMLDIVRQLGALAGPAAGGAILVFGNDFWLLLIASSLLIISVFPLIGLKKVPTKPENKEYSFKEMMKDPLSLRDHASNILDSLHGAAEEFCFSIFIFTMFKSFESIAWLGVLASVAAIVFSYMIGSRASNYRSIFGFIGGLALAGLWLSRVWVGNSLLLYLTAIGSGLFIRFITIPTDNSYFVNSRKIGPLQTSIYRNAFSMLPNIIFFLIMFIVSNVFTTGFSIAVGGMICLALLNLRYMFVRDKKA